MLYIVHWWPLKLLLSFVCVCSSSIKYNFYNLHVLRYAKSQAIVLSGLIRFRCLGLGTMAPVSTGTSAVPLPAAIAMQALHCMALCSCKQPLNGSALIEQPDLDLTTAHKVTATFWLWPLWFWECTWSKISNIYTKLWRCWDVSVDAGGSMQHWIQISCPKAIKK